METHKRAHRDRGGRTSRQKCKQRSSGDDEHVDLGKVSEDVENEVLESLRETGESEDAEEAFNDLEDETMLCADYVPQTRNKRLPDAIIIGARKVNILIKSVKKGKTSVFERHRLIWIETQNLEI